MANMIRMFTVEHYNYFNQKEISEEEVKRLYNIYLENIHTAYTIGIPFDFLAPIDIKNRTHGPDIGTEDSLNDPAFHIAINTNQGSTSYIKEIDPWLVTDDIPLDQRKKQSLERIDALGRDIVKNGTYWPLIVHDNRCTEGIHRAKALQRVAPYRRTLCIVQNDGMLSGQPIHTDSYITDEPYKINMIYPSEVIIDKITRIGLKVNSIKKVEDDLYEIYTVDKRDIIGACVWYGAYLSRCIYRYIDTFKPPIQMNNKAKFFEFVSKPYEPLEL